MPSDWLASILWAAKVAIIDDADHFGIAERQLLAQNAGGAAAECAVDSDRHEPEPAIAHDSFALAGRAISRTRCGNGCEYFELKPARLLIGNLRRRAAELERRKC